MNEAIIYTIIAFLLSLLCGIIVTPIIIRFCHKHGFYDIPNARKVHTNKIPRLGGICFLPSMLLAFVMAAVMMNINLPEREITVSLWSVIFLCGLITIFAIGVIDDLVGLSAAFKFFVQIAAAALLPFSGLYINNFYGFLGIEEIPFWIGAPLTVFVIVFVNNAINLIDGIDGLCSLLSVTALAGFFVGFALKGIWGYCILIAGLIGVVLAFCYYNIFGKEERHTKVFMGDSGSLTLGYMLGFLIVKYSMDAPVVMPYHQVSLLLSYSLVLIPVYDVCRVIIVRICLRRPIFSPDKNHFHHKLLRAGYTPHQALIFIIILAWIFIATNMVLYKNLQYSYIVLINLIMWMSVHAIINQKIKKNNLPVTV